jgi:hypothetical protein
MRLPTHPKTVKPKIKTIANMIQSRFNLLRPRSAEQSKAPANPKVAGSRLRRRVSGLVSSFFRDPS